MSGTINEHVRAVDCNDDKEMHDVLVPILRRAMNPMHPLGHRRTRQPITTAAKGGLQGGLTTWPISARPGVPYCREHSQRAHSVSPDFPRAPNHSGRNMPAPRSKPT